MSGPNDNYKSSDHSMSVYLDNDNRKVYMLRPKQDLSIKNEAFMASGIENQINKIYKDEK